MSDLDEVLARLRRERDEIEARLTVLEARLSLTPEEEHERARLKKLKLAKKDLMVRLLRRSP